MLNNPKPKCMLLIKDDSKTADVFYTVMNNLDSKHPIMINLDWQFEWGKLNRDTFLYQFDFTGQLQWHHQK